MGVGRLDFGAGAYLHNTMDFLEVRDVVSGLIKGAAFGFIVALDGMLFRHEFGARRAGRGPRHQGRGRRAERC